MTTVFLGEHPDVQTLIDQRRALGQDGRDEVWEGVYYVTPHAHIHHGVLQIRLGRVLDDLAGPRGYTVSSEFNLGKQSDYRVPDLGVHRGTPSELYMPTAAMVVEILSPGDRTYEKFSFFRHYGVEEILVVDLNDKSMQLWVPDATLSYQEAQFSEVLGTSCRSLQASILWP
jgi:Uma2 family endonuclease